MTLEAPSSHILAERDANIAFLETRLVQRDLKRCQELRDTKDTAERPLKQPRYDERVSTRHHDACVHGSDSPTRKDQASSQTSTVSTEPSTSVLDAEQSSSATSVKSETSSVDAKARQRADTLRARLRMARFKLETCQTSTPMDRLLIPSRPAPEEPKLKLVIQSAPYTSPEIEAAKRRRRSRNSAPLKRSYTDSRPRPRSQEHRLSHVLTPAEIGPTQRVSDERGQTLPARLERTISVPNLPRMQMMPDSPKVTTQDGQRAFNGPRLHPPAEPDLTSSAVKNKVADTLLELGKGRYPAMRR